MIASLHLTFFLKTNYTCGVLFLLAHWCRFTRLHAFSLDVRACFHFHSKWCMQKFSQKSEREALISLELLFNETSQGFKMMPGETCVSGDARRNAQRLGWLLRLLSLIVLHPEKDLAGQTTFNVGWTWLFWNIYLWAHGQRLRGHVMLWSTFPSLMRQGDLFQIYVLLLACYCITDIERMTLAWR